MLKPKSSTLAAIAVLVASLMHSACEWSDAILTPNSLRPLASHSALATLPVIATIPVGSGAVEAAVNTATNKVYLTTRQSVTVVDGATDAVIKTIPLPLSDPSAPQGVAINALTNRIYVASWQPANVVFVIDGATDQVVATVAVGSGPHGVGVNPNTNRIYVNTCWNESQVFTIDGATNQVVAVTTLAGECRALGVDPAANRVYTVSNTPGGFGVFAIDGATGQVLASTPTIVANNGGLEIDPSTGRVYLTDHGASVLLVLDGASLQVLATVPVGANPLGVGLNPTTGRLFVANPNSNDVTVVDAATNTVIATVPVGRIPEDAGVNPNSGKIYVPNFGDGTVSVISDYLPVAIDIKPGSFPNSINLGSSGSVPVAILSSPTFDATTVDPLTVTLANAGVALRGRGAPMAAAEDVNADGRLDLVVHVETSALALTASDTQAVLEGRMFDGIRIRGVDSVRIVP